MAVNSPLPTFLEINYTSAYGTHKSIMPTLPVVGVGDPLLPFGSFRSAFTGSSTLGSGSGEVGSIIGAWVDLVRGLHFNSTTFDSWAIWQVPDYPNWISGANQTQEADVITGAAFTAKIGTSAPVTNVEGKATQSTLTFRSVGRGLFKVTLLDCYVTNWDRNGMMGTAAYIALRNQVLASDFFGRARNNGKPISFLQQSATLNEKMRRAYRMT